MKGPAPLLDRLDLEQVQYLHRGLGAIIELEESSWQVAISLSAPHLRSSSPLRRQQRAMQCRYWRVACPHYEPLDAAMSAETRDDGGGEAVSDVISHFHLLPAPPETSPQG